jgi:hypothetical protein
MAKHAVDILIRARDEASRQFGIIGHAGLHMGSMLRKAATLIGFYFGAREIKRYVQESLRAYGEEEMAIQHLIDALFVLGPVSKETQKDMQKFADEIRRTTTLADHEILSVMTLGVTIGKLSGEALQKATIAAIGLSKGFGIPLETAMRLVSKGAVGISTGLKRVGIDIKGCKDEQSLYNKVMEIGTKNFTIAQGETKTYAGTVLQMRNALEQVRVTIGQALMPTFKKWAETIRDWADRNREAIGLWAQTMMSGVELVKDIFRSYIDFMKSDWLTGFQKTLFGATTLFIALAKDFGLIAKKIIIDLENILVVGVGKIYTKWVDYHERFATELSIITAREKNKGFLGMFPSEEQTAEARKAAMKTIAVWEREGRYEKLFPTVEGIPWKDIAEKSKETLQKALSDVIALFGPEFGKSIEEAFERHKERLSKITTDIIVEPVKKDLLSTWEDIATSIKGLEHKGVTPLISRFLTMWPSAKIDYQKSIADNTRRQISLTEELVEQGDELLSRRESTVELVAGEL